jgi:hypothetical protein
MNQVSINCECRCAMWYDPKLFKMEHAIKHLDQYHKLYHAKLLEQRHNRERADNELVDRWLKKQLSK